LEAGDRVGGRLYTVTPDGSDVPAELGGIAVRSTDALVTGVADRLELAREPLAGGDPADLLYLRGRRFRGDQWSERGVVPYRLGPAERGRTPEQILAAAVAAVVPDAATLDAAGWAAAKPHLRYAGRPLTDLGLWDVLRALVSEDAFALLEDAGAFRPQFQNWNAADAFADLSAGWRQGVRYERLRDGYESLARALARAAADAGASISSGRRVTSVEAETTFVLHVDGAADVSARAVVLALPHIALRELIARSPLAGDEGLARDLDAVTAVPLFHCFLAYAEPWWEQLGIHHGRSSTDLPVQSCFYFDGGLLMVGYSTPAAIEFWDRYLPDRPDKAHPVTPPPAMVGELSRQLAELHDLAVPEPEWMTLMDWRPPPFGGASHRWRVGARSWEVIPRVRARRPDLPLYVCGEAYSDDQGWVEGALQTAELVVRDHFDVDQPDWLRPGPAPR
ncbi:MAG: flavin monoamine oxidase family protein, partial [Acidimicrobiia bacterium]